MLRHLVITFAVAAGLSAPVFSQDSDSHDKNFDVRSSVGDLHVGDDADAKKVGVPLYPGARLKTDDKNNNQANFAVLTEAFGMKLIVANYVSNDDPGKIVDFYRDKLKRVRQGSGVPFGKTRRRCRRGRRRQRLQQEQRAEVR